MSKTGLFGSTPTKSKNLVEFKAGKMRLDDKNWVHADKRKGLVYIHRGIDDLIHFCWKDRTSGQVEDDLIVFPEDTEFKRIPQCTTGRVYVLKFKNSKKLFLWLQEPKVDKDDEICKSVNESLNSPPSQASTNIRNNLDSDMQDILTGLGGAGYSISQNDIMSLLGIDNSGLRSESELSSRVSPANPSTKNKKPIEPKVQPKPEVTPIAESSTDGSVKIKINDLRSVLSNIQSNYGEKPIHIDLTDAISSDSILPLLEKPENVARLEPLLPPCEITSVSQHIKDNIQSPQMHSAVKSFGSALQSGDLAPVIAHFGLGEQVNEACKTGNVKSFAQAMETDLRVKHKSADEDDDDQESMPVDETSQGDEAMEHD